VFDLLKSLRVILLIALLGLRGEARGESKFSITLQKAIRTVTASKKMQHKSSSPPTKYVSKVRDKSKNCSAQRGQCLLLPVTIKTKDIGFAEISIQLKPFSRREGKVENTSEESLIRLASETIVTLSEDSSGTLEVTLNYGKIWIQRSYHFKGRLSLNVPLLEPVSLSQVFVGEWSYDPSTATVRVVNLSEPQTQVSLRSFGQGSSPLSLGGGEIAEFQAELTSEGRVKIDQILGEIQAVVGRWVRPNPGEIEKLKANSDRVWSELISKAEKANKQEIQIRQKKVTPIGLCASPSGDFNQCLYSKESKDGGLCRRRRCLANGQWGAEFIYPRGRGPCADRALVGPCDY
jgi:hypothetical protein